MNYSELIYGIKQSIKGEIQDYDYYTKLAEKAPNQKAKEIILDIAKDQKEHIQILKEAYYRLTGRMVDIVPESTNITDYKIALEQSALKKISDSRKYRDFYISTKLEWLKDIFLNVCNQEIEHAMKELLLIIELKQDA